MSMENQQDYDMDLASAEAASALGGFEPIPAGPYTARLLVKDLGVSRNGYPQVTQDWQIVEGEYTGRVVKEWVVFGPKSAPFIKARFIGLGLSLPRTILKATALAAYYAREAQGKVAEISVGEDSGRDDGKVYNNVLNIRVFNGMAPAMPRISDGSTVSASELADEVPF